MLYKKKLFHKGKNILKKFLFFEKKFQKFFFSKNKKNFYLQTNSILFLNFYIMDFFNFKKIYKNSIFTIFFMKFTNSFGFVHMIFFLAFFQSFFYSHEKFSHFNFCLTGRALVIKAG